MRSAGAILLLAGALGAVTYGLNAPREDAGRQQAGVARIVTSQTGHAGGTAETGIPRVFSPQRPLLAPEPAAVPAERRLSPANVEAPRVPSAAAVGSGVEPPLPAVVAIRPRKPAPPAPTASDQAQSPPARLASVRPLDEDARDTLVRELQRELKRLGCYEGEVDGDWGSGSRRAMRSFTQRVNAALPTEEPDHILLSLARGQSAPSCGKTCPASQALDNEGRCQPKAVLTQSARAGGAVKSRSEMEPRVAALGPIAPSVAELPAPLPGRMSVGGPSAGLEPSSGLVPAPAPGVQHSGTLASLDNQAAPESAAAQLQAVPPLASRQAGTAGRAKLGTGAAPRREQARERDRSYRQERERYSPPPRYSSFSRRGAVHDFFFDPRRTSY